ncbi:MAG: SDR family NAD(P)-dependent oxidoreductase, partial [Nitrospiraceae bacterium]
KIILVTGASSGIGRSCAEQFGAAGARLILVARRSARLNELASQLRRTYQTDCYPIPLDVRNRRAVEDSIRHLPPSWRAIQILINNAGLSRGLHRLPEGSVRDWEEMIDTNIKGLLYVSRAVIPGMMTRKRGTIINIGSIAGHDVYPRGTVYCATKRAVDGLTKGLRMDLVDTPLRVCTVDPGLVETEFSVVRFRGNVRRAKQVYEHVTPLTPHDVAEAVLFCATRPPHVQIAEMIVLATAQAGSTMVHRAPKGRG